MARPFKSDRHAALSESFPSELKPRGFGITGPHRRRAPLRTRRYLALIAVACCYALYRCFTTT